MVFSIFNDFVVAAKRTRVESEQRPATGLHIYVPSSGPGTCSAAVSAL
jgi:hypothetical protein